MQLAQLDRIDHKIKEEFKPDIYIRYMDDFLIVCRDKEKLEEIASFIEAELKKLGHRMTNKEGIYPIRRGIVFLKMRFILTDSGKVVTKISDRCITRERGQLRNFKRMVDRGKRSMDDVRRHYQSWISMVKPYDSGGALKQMDLYYEKLFGEKPQYKYKRRKHRHGSIKPGRAAPQGAAEKRSPEGRKQETERADRVHRCMRSPGNA
jgi:hypothetical protein